MILQLVVFLCASVPFIIGLTWVVAMKWNECICRKCKQMYVLPAGTPNYNTIRRKLCGLCHKELADMWKALRLTRFNAQQDLDRLIREWECEIYLGVSVRIETTDG